MNKTYRPIFRRLIAAFISFIFSVVLWLFVDKEAGSFVGLWVPSILALAAVVRRPA